MTHARDRNSLIGSGQLRARVDLGQAAERKGWETAPSEWERESAASGLRQAAPPALPDSFSASRGPGWVSC